MFLFCKRGKYFIILIIEFLLLLSKDGPLNRNQCTTVAANINSTISKPFLQIEKFPITRLIITEPHLPHYLQCNATIDALYYNNETIFFYTWFRNDMDVKHRGDFVLSPNGTLRLPPNERASGLYRCKINANEKAVLSELITVEYPILKRIAPNAQGAANISAIVGEHLTLNCPMLSVPRANISWSYGNLSVANANANGNAFNDNRFLILTNGSLVLRQLSMQHAGKYKCTVENQFAAKKHRQFIWLLSIKMSSVLPALPSAQLLPYLQNVTQLIPQGGRLQLVCHATNDLVPIEWWFQRTNNGTLYKLSNNSAIYSIANAKFSEHEGFYICATKLTKQTFHVIVTIAPIIIEQLRVYEGHITASLMLRCRAEGNPKPTYSWYHNGAPLISSYTRYINGNDLHIHSFDPDEDGIYQCFAHNIAGEDYTAGEIRYSDSNDQQLLQVNPLQNIRCYAHSFNTINVTFDNRAMESLFIVHIVLSNPHRWITPFAPMKLNHTSYVIISSHLPVYRPFELITRSLFPISEIRTGNKPYQQTIFSSLRSQPVTCCTQGLLLHLVHIGNDTFVTWSQPDLVMKKYLIIQFSINYTQPHPEQIFEQPISGTVEHVELNADDVLNKLTYIEPLNQTAAMNVLQRVETTAAAYNDILVTEQLEPTDDILSIVVPASVTGIFMQNFIKIKLRVLIITAENENLRQDFRYVQWKIIENDTSELSNMPFRLTIVESRMLMFHFFDGFNDTCVQVCHLQIQYPIINKEEPICEQRTVKNSLLALRNLRPNVRYHLHFSSCETQIFFGQLDVQTLPDPPGTISNQRVIRHNGLKLIWDPPLQPNGRVHHYNILWTLGNVTHEANVFECSDCFYKFPNISENAKINVTVRVVGETGIGAPIFIDLRHINHHSLEIERPNHNSEVYSGIAIGSLLSVLCISFFALLIIFQRRRYKARQQGPTHLSTPTDINFGNLSNPGMPTDSAGGLSGSTLQQDCHEMQTLIPRSRYNIELLPEHTVVYQTTPLPNGNSSANVQRVQEQQQQCDLDQSTLQDSYLGISNLSQLPLCHNSPERKLAVHETLTQEAKAFFIPFKHTPPNAVATVPATLPLATKPTLQTQTSSQQLQSHKKTSSSLLLNANNSAGIIETAMPPNSLPLVSTVPFINIARRSGSLSSSNSGSIASSNNGSKKQYHTNFTKHSNSNDGICLLAEEESAATLTPTSEHDVAIAVLTNGYKTAKEDASTAPTSSKANLNNNRTTKSTGSSNSNSNSTSMTKLSGLLHRRTNVDPNG